MKSSAERTALLTSIVVNLVAISTVLLLLHKMGGWGYLKAKYYEYTVGSPYSDPSRPFYESTAYRQAVSIHDLTPVEEGDVVFMGDSHAAQGHWSEFFGTTRVRNRGISGDNTEGVLRRLEPVLAGSPSALFLFIGSNDVNERYKGLSVDETVANVERILSEARASSPQTEVFLLSAPPKSRNTTLNATETPLAHALSERYASLEFEAGAVYVDILGALTDSGGSLRVDYTEDGGHLNGAGYEAVVNVLRAHVESALNRVVTR